MPGQQRQTDQRQTDQRYLIYFLRNLFFNGVYNLYFVTGVEIIVCFLFCGIVLILDLDLILDLKEMACLLMDNNKDKQSKGI